MQGGWMGRILHVDLTAGRHWVEELDAGLLRSLIGGSGLGVYLLQRLTSADTDPLGPDNPLILAVGPCCGTKIPLSGRVVAVTRSPLTGVYGEAESGNSFATGLKAAGYDALVLRGQARDPVYLWLDDGQVEVRPAAAFWGLDAFDTEAGIKAETAAGAGVACIGQAGENLMPMAGIMSDAPHARTMARCGVGAVMGSKKLKAVAARGSHETPIARPGELQKLLKASFGGIVQKTKRFKEFGTAGGVVGNAVLGDMAARNWVHGDWVEGAEKIGGEVMKKELHTGQYYCPACVVGCGREVRIDTGPFAGTKAGGPEYESIAGFGAQVLIEDIRKIVELNDLCNRYGMDTISVSGAIAFALEAMERGLLARDPDLPAGPLWGNPDLVVALVHKMARLEGVGGLLAQGVKKAAAQIGQGAHRFAMHARGLELAYHDPRALSTLAVGYATHPRGGCHRLCVHYLERYAFPDLGFDAPFPRHEDAGKGRAVAIFQNYTELYQLLRICQFQLAAVTPPQILGWFNALTGCDMDLAEFLRVGERVLNLKRLFNLRCGSGAEDDAVPPRLLEEPFAAGTAQGFVPNLQLQLEEYYATRGWDAAGRPLPQTLAALGIELEK